MTKTIKAICVAVGVLCLLFGLSPDSKKISTATELKNIKGVWAATLFSMDYPQAPTTDWEQLKADADRLVADVKSHGFNTLFLQVRPCGDAFYKSEIFPVSRYLSGTEGEPPRKSFDPLEYIIEKAHKNNISLHAWINPYRITATEKDTEKLSETSLAKKYPHLVLKHTDGKLYLNPGEPEAIDLAVKGAAEIAKNYDVDGIHIDDYFYPSSAFPDGETFTKYGGSFLDIGDWRRNNTTRLVKEMGNALKAAKPQIIFSVSPCGIWANKESLADGSDTLGKQAYFDYYADTRLWVKEELVDMIIPQVYWEAGNPFADFEKVAEWWNDTVAGTDVALCIGQGVYKAADEKDPDSPWYGLRGCTELENQLKFISRLENVCGYVQYRIGSITQNPDLSKLTKRLNAE